MATTPWLASPEATAAKTSGTVRSGTRIVSAEDQPVAAWWVKLPSGPR